MDHDITPRAGGQAAPPGAHGSAADSGPPSPSPSPSPAFRPTRARSPREPDRFRWTTFDVTALLPAGWEADLDHAVRTRTSVRVVRPPHTTSREDGDARSLRTLTVRGAAVRELLPWVVDLYGGAFRELGAVHAGRELLAAAEPRYAVVLNVQEPGGDRGECHVDTNPIAGLLYATDHHPGTGGELAVAHDPDARNTRDVDRDCALIRPQRGHLVFFDGRFSPHYVRAVTDGPARVAVAMNYYTADCPESHRPGDLDTYLYGAPAT